MAFLRQQSSVKQQALHPVSTRRSVRLLLPLGVMLIAALLAGCKEEKQTTFADILEKLDAADTLGTAVEVELGDYCVSSAIPVVSAEDQEKRSVWVQIKFKLYALVNPKDKQAVLQACKKQRGKLDDIVMTVSRKATLEELKDSRWVAFKSRLIDALRPVLGDQRIQHLTLDDFVLSPI